MEVACMDGVNIEKNEKKDALLIAIEEGRTIVKDPNAPIFQYGRLKSGIGSIISLIEKESQQNALLLTLFYNYDLKQQAP